MNRDLKLAIKWLQHALECNERLEKRSDVIAAMNHVKAVLKDLEGRT